MVKMEEESLVKTTGGKWRLGKKREGHRRVRATFRVKRRIKRGLIYILLAIRTSSIRENWKWEEEIEPRKNRRKEDMEPFTNPVGRKELARAADNGIKKLEIKPVKSGVEKKRTPNKKRIETRKDKSNQPLSDKGPEGPSFGGRGKPNLLRRKRGRAKKKS